ncbi:MAG: hypothetical protein ACETWK_12245 [Candidatus Aminicenantaceae bacterium]
MMNSNIDHKGVLFHIQTQDKGPKVNYVESLIFKSGKLLSSRKASYLSCLRSPELKEKIEQLIKGQHHTIIKEITEGKFDHFLNSTDP